uniref:N-acetylglucosamine-1-phosphotransferase subunits alpha/beta isoform X2 n=1 Tax=Myxine glutinosa TaxID=7769 RepID=UPI00358E14A2
MLIRTTMKRFQRRAYSFLSRTFALSCCLVISLALTFAILLISGQTLLQWSRAFLTSSPDLDNIVGHSFKDRLFPPLPIDAVYTWVNGSDQYLIEALESLREQLVIEREQKMGHNATEAPQRNTELDCPDSPCFWAPLLLLSPPYPTTHALPQPLSAAFKVLPLPSSAHNLSVLSFHNLNDAQKAMQAKQQINSVKDIGNKGVLMPEMALLGGFLPSLKDANQLSATLSSSAHLHISQLCLLTEDMALAWLHSLESFSVLSHLAAKQNMSLPGSRISLHSAWLHWGSFLNNASKKGGDLATSRFADNEELRFSLRSLERHAPWIRRIHIVTNGQIPSWLDLDNPRVSLVTHKDIFPDIGHLPTFSSPAIESHLHRIPGISPLFLYFNDDVFLARDVWPEDFYTHSRGQKVYLSWPVPNCAEGCPPSWVHDGYCDHACNLSICDWDGGDCSENRTRFGILRGGGGAAFGAGGHAWGGAMDWRSGLAGDDGLCNTGCAWSWLADRFCDQACNVLACSFDVGDCGNSNYDQLTNLSLGANSTSFSAPHGATQLLISYSHVAERVINGAYTLNPSLRHASVTNKFRSIHVILTPNCSAQVLQLNFTLINHSGQQFVLNLSIHVDTTGIEKSLTWATHVNATPEYVGTSNGSLSVTNRTTRNKTKGKEEQPFEGVPEWLMFPKIRKWNEHKGNKTQEPGRVLEVHKPGNKQRRNEVLNYVIGDRVTVPSRAIKSQKSSLFLKKGDDGLPDEKSISMPSQKPHGFLPWEKTNYFGKLTKGPEDRLGQGAAGDGKAEGDRGIQIRPRSRRLLDTYGDSLRHVNSLFNQHFGFYGRRVPAHMPHLVQKDIMQALQDEFPEQFEQTSSHKVRRGDDMQFSFSYYYYLMGAVRQPSIARLFQELDTDLSGHLSDRELRTLATRVYASPLTLQNLSQLEQMLINCSHLTPPNGTLVATSVPSEPYYTRGMPPVTLLLLQGCSPVANLLKKTFKEENVYRFEVMGEEDIAFKMIHSNVSHVVAQLDDIRKNPRKFVCLNDNMEHGQAGAVAVRAVLRDFYESLFPQPTRFELPPGYRNRFLHICKLNEWRKFRDQLRFWTHLGLFLLILLTILSFCSEKVSSVRRRLLRRRPHGMWKDKIGV